MLLAGDIGGTKTDLAIFSPEAGPRAPLRRQEFPSGQYPSLEAILHEFLAEGKEQITQACLAVAGPVIGGRAKITNLSWVVALDSLQAALGIVDVVLINDLQAIALAVPILEPGELVTLNEGAAIGGGPIAVVAPGTGMGQAFLTWNGTRYEAHASEGGHSDFAPANAVQTGLLAYMQQRYPHVSVERVCSGRGLPNVYDYLRDSEYERETPAIAAELAAVADRTPVIIKHALEDHPCPLCFATVELFVSIMGAVAGNLALTVFSTGGLYLAGGLPPRILTVLQDGHFMAAFGSKGRLSPMLAQMPVHVVLSRAAMLGVGSYGLSLMAGRAGQ